VGVGRKGKKEGRSVLGGVAYEHQEARKTRAINGNEEKIPSPLVWQRGRRRQGRLRREGEDLLMKKRSRKARERMEGRRPSDTATNRDKKKMKGHQGTPTAMIASS